MASVTVNLTGFSGVSSLRIIWHDDISLGSDFSSDNSEQTLITTTLWDHGEVTFSLEGANSDFREDIEATGIFTFTASDNETLEVLIANADMTEPYSWEPINTAEVSAFVTHVRGLSNQNATLTIADGQEAATAPDLVLNVPTITPIGVLEPGQTIRLDITVLNIGDASAASTTLQWRQSTDNDITSSDLLLNTDLVPALGIGGIVVESINFSVPSTPGTYYYGATIDAVSGESDTGNNASGALTVVVEAVTVTAPDLTIDTPTRIPSGNLTPNQSFALTAVVRNVGNADSESTTLTWRIGNSVNISESDLQVGTESIGVLSPGATSTVSMDFTASPMPGTIYYGATVAGVTDESDTENNASVGIAVVVAAISNVDPVADAGSDQSVAAGASVSLDGTGSSDSDGNIVSYEWTQLFGDDVTLIDADTSTPDFTAPSTNTAQILTFILTVTDNDGATDDNGVNISVAATTQTNMPPTANAGSNQSVGAGASVSLDGSTSSDADGNIVSYAWTQTAGDNVTLTGADTSTPSFTAPSTDSAQTLIFRLTVTDDDGATNTDDVNINVAAVVAPPMPGTETRLDTIAALDSLFTRFNTGPDQGAWVVDDVGTTTSSGTGPGTNSEGPYVFSESSGSDDNLPNISILTALASVMAAWTGLGRMLLLRACIQGSGSYPNDSASGLQIQGRASSSDPWALIDLLEGWVYDTNYVVGSTVTDSLGVTQTIVQDGGWVDFAVLIPDDYTQLRIRNIPAMGASAFTHDAALWHAEFRNGSGVPDRPPVVSITTATNMDVASGSVLNLTATASDPDNQNLTYLWEAFELQDFLFNSSPTELGGFSNNVILSPTWTAPMVASATNFALRLTVTDTDNLTENDSITVRGTPYYS